MRLFRALAERAARGAAAKAASEVSGLRAAIASVLDAKAAAAVTEWTKEALEGA